MTFHIEHEVYGYKPVAQRCVPQTGNLRTIANWKA